MRIGHSSSDTQPGLARTCGDDVGGLAGLEREPRQPDRRRTAAAPHGSPGRRHRDPLICPDAHIAWAVTIDEPTDSAAPALREALSGWFGTP